MRHWTIDLDHSHVGFAVRHLAIATVRGRFRLFAGHIETDDAGTPLRLEATADAASIDTGVERRDAHLRSGDFLDAGAHPVLALASAHIVAGDAGAARVDATLTMRGVTHPVSLALRWHGPLAGTAGEPRLVGEATATIRRSQWGLTWNRAIEAGGMAVSDEVSLHFEVQAVPA